MANIKNSAKIFYDKLPPIGKYLLFSVIVTVVDAAISWFLSMRMNIDLQIANSIGIVIGAILHYIMSSGEVFDMKYGIAGGIIFFGTFAIGIFLANWIISVAFSIATSYFLRDFAFLVAKGFSIVIPFFALYFLRKFLYGAVKRRMDS